MASQRKLTRAAIDQLRENLQELPIRRAVESSDRRRLVKSQRLAGELKSEFRPSEVAQELGISVQKWTALRLKIERGQVYGEAVNVLLERQLDEMRETPLEKIEKTTVHIKGVGKRSFEAPIWYVPNKSWLDKNAPWSKDLKPGGFRTYRGASEWLLKSGAGVEYFFIVRQKTKTGAPVFHVYDMRTPGELSRKGHLGKGPKVLKTLQRKGKEFIQ